MGKSSLLVMGLVRMRLCRWPSRRRITDFMVRHLGVKLAHFFIDPFSGVIGRTECTYEPAMTKSFLHGRTEAIRTVQPESLEFTKVRYP